jgi:hypothetical protein
MSRYTITAYLRCYKDPELVLISAAHLLWADELVIADNSNDDSVKDVISQIKHHNLKYFKTDIADWRHRLNNLRDKIAGDYVLLVDTDEFYREETGREILNVLADPNAHEGYKVPMESYIFGEDCGVGDEQLRLLKRDKFYMEFRSVHEMPKVPGSTGRLKNGYIHFNSPMFSSMASKIFGYALNDAKLLSNEDLLSKRLDSYSSFQLKVHFFKKLLKIVWRSKSLLFKKISFVNLLLQYANIIVIISNDTAATEEIRMREGKTDVSKIKVL